MAVRKFLEKELKKDEFFWFVNGKSGGKLEKRFSISSKEDAN